MLKKAVFWICLLIFHFSLLKYTYHYNYRSHISLQVAKLAKSAGVQILIFPTVYRLFARNVLQLEVTYDKIVYLETTCKCKQRSKHMNYRAREKNYGRLFLSFEYTDCR